MQSPYTPRYSRVPNPTPRASASIRAPIHNPYDKFTQPEFDDWIGGITTALRKALGQEEEDAQSAVQKHDVHGLDATNVATFVAEEGEGVDDSFADLKARRAKVQGKMRAVEEPGGSISDADEDSEPEESVLTTNARGSSPGNAIELSSDEDDDDGEEASVRELIRNATPDSETSEEDSPLKASTFVQPSNITAKAHHEVPDDDDDSGEFEAQGADETWSVDHHPQTQEESQSQGQSPDRLTPETQNGWEQESDIHDPWELPVEYAEDLYTGGDIPVARGTTASPSHITEDDDIQHVPQHPSLLPNGHPLTYEAGETVESDIRASSGKVEARVDPDTIDEVDYDELDQEPTSREATPEPETPAIRERVKEAFFTTTPVRPRSPTFALNDRVDWNTPSFDDRVSQSRLFDGEEVETGSEVTSEEEVISISEDSDGLYDGRSPPPLGTSDLDPHAQDGDDELDDYDDEHDDPNFYGFNQPADAPHLTGTTVSHDDDYIEISDGEDDDDGDEPQTPLATRKELTPELELSDPEDRDSPSLQQDAGITRLTPSADEGQEQIVPVVQDTTDTTPLAVVPDNAPTSEKIYAEASFTENSTDFQQAQVDETVQFRHEVVSQSAAPPSEEPATAVQESFDERRPEQQEMNAVSSAIEVVGHETDEFATIVTPSLIRNFSEEFLNNHADITELGPTLGELLDSGEREQISPPPVEALLDSFLGHAESYATHDLETHEAVTRATLQTSKLDSVLHHADPDNSTSLPTATSFEELEYVDLGPGSPISPKHEGEAEFSSVKDLEVEHPLEYVVEEPLTESEAANEPEPSLTEEKAAAPLLSSPPMSPITTAVEEIVETPTSPRAAPVEFVRPLVANPNVHDPMSVIHSPVPSVPSQPETPRANLTSLPSAVGKFMRDNHLSTDAPNSTSGLFTPSEAEEGSIGVSSVADENTTAVVDDAIAVADDAAEGDKELMSIPIGASGFGKEEVVEELENVPEEDAQDDTRDSIASSPRTPKLSFLPRLKPELATWTNKAQGRVSSSEEDTAELELAYSASEVPSAHDEDLVRIPGLAHDEDEDAEGIPDPDYTDSSPKKDSKHDYQLPTAEAVAEARAEAEHEVDPFKLMGNESLVAPGPVTPDESETPTPSNEEETVEEIKPSDTPKKSDEPEVPATISLPQTPKPTNFDPREASPAVDVADKPVPAPEPEDRPKAQKRKRSPSVQGSSALNRSVSLGKLRTYGGKSSDKVQTEKPGSEAQEKLAPSPVIVLQPPVVVKQELSDGDFPMFHGHGKNKKAQLALPVPPSIPDRGEKVKAKEPQPVVPAEQSEKLKLRIPARLKMPSPQPSVLSALSPAPTSPESSLSSASSSFDFLPASQPAPAKLKQQDTHPELISSSQPAPTSRRTYMHPLPTDRSTRSNCRYRKISIPEDEDAPRITFCVPQCCLNDKELMEEEEITEDGPATQRDYEALFEFVESLNFNAYLIGVLKLLVGVDALRDNDVYYLPKEDEVVMRRTPKGDLKRATRTSYERDYSSTESPRTILSGPGVPPVSTSSTTSTRRNGHGYGSEPSGDEGNVPPTKRRKKNRATVLERPPGGSSTNASPLTARRSNRSLRSRDIHAYNPDSDLDGDDDHQTRRKPARSGMKRSRTEVEESQGSSPLKGSASMGSISTVKTKRVKLTLRSPQQDR